MITAIAERVHMSPAQVVLSWAAQRGTAFLTTSTKPQRIQRTLRFRPCPEDAMGDIRDRITATSGSTQWCTAACPDSSPGPNEPMPSTRQQGRSSLWPSARIIECVDSAVTFTEVFRGSSVRGTRGPQSSYPGSR